MPRFSFNNDLLCALFQLIQSDVQTQKRTVANLLKAVGQLTETVGGDGGVPTMLSKQHDLTDKLSVTKISVKDAEINVQEKIKQVCGNLVVHQADRIMLLTADVCNGGSIVRVLSYWCLFTLSASFSLVFEAHYYCVTGVQFNFVFIVIHDGWRSISPIFAEHFGDLSLVCRVVLVHMASG